MSEQGDTLMLAILKDIQGRLVRLDTKVDDLRIRMDDLVTDHIAVKRDGVRQDETLAHIHVRQDRIEAAVARINARLGLIDSEG